MGGRYGGDDDGEGELMCFVLFQLLWGRLNMCGTTECC